MGMPIQITYEGEEDGLLETQIIQCFDALDAQFSTYKKTSDVSLFNKHKLPESKQNSSFKDVFSACDYWKAQTHGAFDAFYEGSYDPSGYVKSLAIHQASELLRAAGIGYFTVNASGDVLVASNIAESWNVALQNPKNKHGSIGTIRAKNLAIASSGTYERGAHITNPKSGKPVRSLLGITVIGRDIIAADVLATAAFASETSWNTLIDDFDGYEALVILKDGTVQMSSGFESLIS
jgi:thiamine biosynthesis lipoprotein